MKRIAATFGLVAIVIMVTWFLSVNDETKSSTELKLSPHRCINVDTRQVWIEGGTFSMGDGNFYPEEGPVHQVTIDGFWLDTHEVTNKQFAEFVEATGYRTVAERQPNPSDFPGAPDHMLKPGSVIFTPPTIGNSASSWWNYVPGANWKHPEGPDSNIIGKEHHPAVHIAFEDAKAYTEWKGRELPTEAQFEFAARSLKKFSTYPWGGDELAKDGVYRANTWQGAFPIHNSEKDGYKGLAPVGCFEPNDYGVYDLIGNVWEWTANWYAPRHNEKDNLNPKGPNQNQSYDHHNAGYPVKVIKGGSYLCAPNFCARYRPAARHAQDTGLGAGHIGFRTVLNKPKKS